MTRSCTTSRPHVRGGQVDFDGAMRAVRRCIVRSGDRRRTERPGCIRSIVETDYATALSSSPTSRRGGLLLEHSNFLLSLCMIVRNYRQALDATRASSGGLDGNHRRRYWLDRTTAIEIAGPRCQDRRPFPRAMISPPPVTRSPKHAEAGDWIFWMDARRPIDEVNGRKLRALVSGEIDPAILGFVLQVHCPGPKAALDHDVEVVDHLKVFRNRSDLRFEGRIHEQILAAINRANGRWEKTDIFITHSGYDHSPEAQVKKVERDLASCT